MTFTTKLLNAKRLWISFTRWNRLYNDSIISLGDRNDSTIQEELQNHWNKSLIQLEATLLGMAATPQLCQGLLYMFLIKLDDKYIVRYLKIILLCFWNYLLLMYIEDIYVVY